MPTTPEAGHVTGRWLRRPIPSSMRLTDPKAPPSALAATARGFDLRPRSLVRLVGGIGRGGHAGLPQYQVPPRSIWASTR